MPTAQFLTFAWRLGRRSACIACLLALTALALAQSGTVKTTAFPNIALSDGTSPVTLSAEVRDDRGTLVPDGTQVVFECKVGTFDAQTVQTQNGVARTTLHAPSTPGIALVRVSVLRFNAFGETSVEFVKDRGRIESGLRQLELIGGSSLVYSVQDRVFEATGANRTAIARYNRVTIEADEFQCNALDTTVKAHNAVLVIGGRREHYDELNFNLRSQTGVGLGKVEIPGRVVRAGPISMWVPGKSRLGYLDIAKDGAKPRMHNPGPESFAFVPVVDGLSHVSADHATLVLDKNIQFRGATVKMGGETLLKLPYFDYPLTSGSPVISEQFLQVNNNQLALNLPYYTSLSPNLTSLFRMRYSTPFAGGNGFEAGTYLDYEMSWNQGGNANGALTVAGIGRDDWGVNLRQTWLTPSNTIVTAALDSPSHSSLLGNFAVSRPFRGGSATVAYNLSQNLVQRDVRSNSLNVTVQSDQKRLGKTPFHLSTGLTSVQSDYSSAGFSQKHSSVGAQARLTMDTANLGPLGRLRLGYSLSELMSSGTWGTSHALTLGLSTQFSRGLVLDTQYDYTVDPFAVAFMGQHRLSADTYFSRGPWSLRANALRMLDYDRSSARVSMEHRFSPLWRLNYATWLDQFDGERYFDQNLGLGFRLGLREVGLTFSQRTGRVGFELRG